MHQFLEMNHEQQNETKYHNIKLKKKSLWSTSTVQYSLC